jgi:hypothetical protein
MSNDGLSGAEFAARVRESLLERGLDSDATGSLIAEAGPKRALAVLAWTEAVIEEVGLDAACVVLVGLGSFGVMSWQRQMEVLKALDLPAGFVTGLDGLPIDDETPFADGEEFGQVMRGAKVVLRFKRSPRMQSRRPRVRRRLSPVS